LSAHPRVIIENQSHICWAVHVLLVTRAPCVPTLCNNILVGIASYTPFIPFFPKAALSVHQSFVVEHQVNAQRQVRILLVTHHSSPLFAQAALSVHQSLLIEHICSNWSMRRGSPSSSLLLGSLHVVSYTPWVPILRKGSLVGSSAFHH
jgi:hypothetical protein